MADPTPLSLRDSPGQTSDDGSEFGEPMLSPQISERTIARLRWYLHTLNDFTKSEKTVASSREIADKVGVKPGLVRKDLCRFGGFGRPSVGYNVAYLQKKIREILKVSQIKSVAWVGARRLSDEPSLIERFSSNSFAITVVFDADSSWADASVGNLRVLDAAQIDEKVRELGIRAAVIADAGSEAQEVADRLIAGGVTAILNLTQTAIAVPQGVAIRNLDVVGELMLLSYYCGDLKQKLNENDIMLPDNPSSEES